MSFALIFSALLTTAIVTAYLYVKNVFSYWQRKGIRYATPTFPLGNFADAFFQKTTFGEAIEELYKSTTKPVLGIYLALRPTLLLRDPESIRNVLIKDFSSFYHRGMYGDETVDPMADNLLLQNGEKWKRMRTKLSPTFTSGKLKAMFGTVVECGKSLQKYMDKFAQSNQTVEVRDIFARFATNSIASVAFGIDIDCIQNPDTEFRKYGERIFAMSFKNAFRQIISLLSPPLARILRIRFTDKSVQDFMTGIVKQNLEYRETNQVVRKDFFQLLVQLRNNGTVQADGDWTAKISEGEKNLTLNEVTAQAFIFFAGGFETTSTTMSYCMYEMARNLDVQQKAHEEIDVILAKHNGQLTYESISEMKYLEHCIEETLRLHPPFPALTRQCTKDYKLPGTNVVIEDGTQILISIAGIHHDPKYYDQPKRFMPERFSDENKSGKGFTDMPYLPFGEGPRICIGLRLGKMQSKVGVVLMLQRYKFELGAEHINKELKLSPKTPVSAPISGIKLKVSLR